jgi:hypothetical protein
MATPPSSAPLTIVGSGIPQPPPCISITIPARFLPTPQEASISLSPSRSPGVTTSRSPRSSLAVNASSPSSESDIEIIDIEPFQTEWEEDRRLGFPLEERVKREWARRKAAELGAANGGASHNGDSQSIFEPRPPRRGRGILDSEYDTPEAAAATLPSTPVYTKPKFLSPLRGLSTLPQAQDRGRATSPIIPSSPYSFARSTTAFLRSTTSLGRFPLPTKSSTAGKADAPIARKLFSSKVKGKGKEKESSSEALEAWEVVDTEEVPDADAVEAPLNMTVPTKGAGTPALPALNTTATPHPRFRGAFPVTPTQESSSTTLAFLSRPVRRTAASSGLSISTMNGGTPVPPPASPIATPTRAQLPPAPLRSKAVTPPQLTILTSANTPEPALVFPLPPSPRLSPRSTNNAQSFHVRWRASSRRPDDHFPSLHDLAPGLNPGRHDMPQPSSPAGTICSVVSASTPVYGPSVDCFPPTRPNRHYAGRPLPRTPPVSPPPMTRGAAPQPCPEGLLIDLDTECPDPRYAAVEAATSDTATPRVPPPDGRSAHLNDAYAFPLPPEGVEARYRVSCPSPST